MRIAVLGGGSWGTTVAAQAAATVVARADPVTARELQRIIRSGLLRVYTNHDVAGCELGGALKNVIAIATGMAEGLGVGGPTVRASLFPHLCARWR